MSRASVIVSRMLEAEEPFDPREYLLAPHDLGGKRIRISYSVYTEDSIAQGDAEEHGWEDQEGVEMEPDEWDREEGLTPAKLAIKFLDGKGAIHPSSSHFSPGIWYSDGNSDWAGDGTLTERNYHLSGFTPEEELEIFNEVAMKI